MKNKYLLAVISCAFIACLLFVVGCSFGDKVVEEEKETIVIPTAAQVVEARENVVSETIQGYDFYININGTVSYAGFNGTANANYEGKYRYDTSSSALQFYRETSGLLLYDSKEYIYTNGNAKIKIKLNEDGEVTKTQVTSNADQKLSLVNKPFCALIDALKEDNFNKIELNTDGEVAGFKYCATLKLTSSNETVQALFDYLEKLGTNVEIKGVSFTNPNGGVKFYFNWDASTKRLKDFTFNAGVNFTIKGADVAFNITYKQTEATNDISMPSITNLVTAESDITTIVNKIDAAIINVKNSDIYSIGLDVSNEFDPGWSTTAIKDSYKALMYKHKIDETYTAFNKSYVYKSHSEEDGKEAYKFTLGNVTNDGKVYLVSRKGSNTYEEKTGASVNSTFESMVNIADITAADIDCVRVSEATDGTITYKISMSDAYALSFKDKIVNLLNTNETEGVVNVNNYFNGNENFIKNADLIVVIKDNKLVSFNCCTKIKYYPTDGNYSEDRVTLTNSVTIKVDEWYSYAEKYTSPSKPDGSIVGLVASKYYIL